MITHAVQVLQVYELQNVVINNHSPATDTGEGHLVSPPPVVTAPLTSGDLLKQIKLPKFTGSGGSVRMRSFLCWKAEQHAITVMKLTCWSYLREV